MAQIHVDWRELQVLMTLANFYCTSALKHWVRQGDVDRPASDEERRNDLFVIKCGYEVLAEVLDIPREYLEYARYPSPSYTLDKRVYLPQVGFAHFTVYARGKSPSSGLLRFYVECPACGKSVPVGRMNQHIGGHQKQATLVDARSNMSNMTFEEYEYLDTNEFVHVTEYTYLLKRRVRTTRKRFPQWTHTVSIREDMYSGALVFAHCLYSKRTQLDIVGEDAQDALAQVLERAE